MKYINLKTKRLLLGLLALICIYILGLQLYNYFYFGTLTVGGSAVNGVVEVSKETGVSVAQINSGETIKIKKGIYLIRLESDGQASKQRVSVHSHTNNKYRLRLSKFSDPEVVIGSASKNIVVDGKALRYFDVTTNSIVAVSELGIPGYSAQYNIDKIEWADSSFGLARQTDGRFLLINGDSFTNFELPKPYNKNQSVSYALSKDRTIYVSQGGVLYKKRVKGNFEQIYESSATTTTIRARNNSIALIEFNTVSENESAQVRAEIIILDDKGRQIASKKTIASDELDLELDASWSESGDKLAVFNEEAGSFIYSSTLKRLYSIPETPTANPVWLDSNNLIYSLGNGVWKYNLGSGLTSRVANFGTEGTISEITIDRSNSYIYLTTNSDTVSGTYRFGLGVPPVSETVRKLGIFLPAELPECSLYYLGYVSPAVIIYPRNISLVSDCRLLAAQYLKDYNVNPDSVLFLEGPVITQIDEI